MTAVRSLAIGLASEVHSALPTSHARGFTPGLATEVDAALAVSIAKALAVGLASELDSAFAVAFVVGGFLNLVTGDVVIVMSLDGDVKGVWVAISRDPVTGELRAASHNRNNSAAVAY